MFGLPEMLLATGFDNRRLWLTGRRAQAATVIARRPRQTGPWRNMPQIAKVADHHSKRGSQQTSDARMLNLSNGFDKLAHWTARHAGRPATFALALAVIVVWGLSGPIFQWSDTWQLIINTGTTIVTFLMVFLIQNTQNRDTEALQLKLDELIRVNAKGRNRLLRLEELTEEEMDHIKATFTRLAKASAPLTEEREDQIG
jgi:low affinity Fe/Cu permease